MGCRLWTECPWACWIFKPGVDGFAVINNGPEIPQAMIDRIFDPFVSTRAQGTGLGLSVAWRIIQAHQGSLLAENTEDGVRFVIRLPA